MAHQVQASSANNGQSLEQSMDEWTAQLGNSMSGDINSLLESDHSPKTDDAVFKVPLLPARLTKPQTIEKALSDIIAFQPYSVIQSPQPAQPTPLNLTSPKPTMTSPSALQTPTPLNLASTSAPQNPVPMTTQLFSAILGDTDLGKKPVPIQRLRIKAPELTPVPGNFPIFLPSPADPDTHVLVEQQFLVNLLNTYQNKEVGIRKDEEIKELKEKLAASQKELGSVKAKLQEVLEERRSDDKKEEENGIQKFCQSQMERLGREAYSRMLAQFEDMSNKTLEIFNRESHFAQPISIAMSDRGCNYFPVDPAAFLKELRSPMQLTQEDLKNKKNANLQLMAEVQSPVVENNNQVEPRPAPQPVAPPAQQNLDEGQQLVHQIFRNANNNDAPLSPATQSGRMGSPMGHDQGAIQQYLAGFNGLQLPMLDQQLAMFGGLLNQSPNGDGLGDSKSWAQDFNFGTGNFPPLSPALSAFALPIGLDQGDHQQSAGIAGLPQWPYIAQPPPSFGSLSLSPYKNGSSVVEKQSNPAKAPTKRGRRPKKQATEEATPTPAAKKQKLLPQAIETDAFPGDGEFTTLGKMMDEMVKEKTIKLENEIAELKANDRKNKEDLRNAMDQQKEQEEKILEDGFKIKSLENAKEILYTVFMALGGSMHRIMDAMEPAWNNKMESLDMRTEAIKEKVEILRELSIDSSQKVVVQLQENLRNTLDEKEKDAEEYKFALQAQHWITEEKEEEWSMRNQCLELEKAEMEATNSELMEKNHCEESKSSFYEQEYKKAMETVAGVQKMVSNSSARFSNKINFQPPEPQPVPPFSGASYSSSDSSLAPYNGANRSVANVPSYAQPPPRFAGSSNPSVFTVYGTMMPPQGYPGPSRNNNAGRADQYPTAGPQVSQAIINNIKKITREEEQKKNKKAIENMGNTIKELCRKLSESEDLVKRQQILIQNRRRRSSSSSNTSEVVIPDIQGELDEGRQENEKLKKKLMILEEEKSQMKKDLQQFQHIKNDVKRLQDLLKAENLKVVAVVKEKNLVDLKLQDSEKKLEETKETLTKINVKLKIELQRIRKEKEQSDSGKVLNLQSPENDSKEQIKKLQDALEEEKKKAVETQAQCAKEKEKAAHLEHRLHQKMKDMEKKDVEVQTEKKSTLTGRRSVPLGEPVTESKDRTLIEHADSLKVRIHELTAENKVMSGELRELKRKLSTEDRKNDELAEPEHKKKKKNSEEPAEKQKSSEKSSDHKPVDTATNDEKSEVKDGDKVKESDEIAKDKKKEQNGRKSESSSDRKPIDPAATKDEKKPKEKVSDGISEVKKKKLESSSDKKPDTSAMEVKKSNKVPEIKMDKKEKKAKDESSDSSSDESLEKLAPKPIRKRGRPPKNPENSGAPKPEKMKHME
ncbi:hypothetical protein CAEBREN_07598 [Caenorhabditis brenneri]|uniref:Uncharacterized protein n=1 Tax=Caenorhabditis brenneri TaxID=135651 RepID=G0PBK4_CAEBE|nr:hypothetical protein CAEBREN_07598 [Caenorhabditis brenneri]